MTVTRLLSPPVASGGAPASSGRHGVTVLSGFLGSGKTTVLRAELVRVGTRAPAVVVNDFGHAPVEESMRAQTRRRPLSLSGGGACCTRQDDLAQALRHLLDEEQRGVTQLFDHVVVETSGLSDPGPIAFTITSDPVLKHHFVLAQVCVTVDALTGPSSINRHDVAPRAADQLLVTKADLATAGEVSRLVERLHQLNPSAGVVVTANGEQLDVLVEGGGDTARTVTPHQTGEHTAAVSTLELVTNGRVDWQAFSIRLSLLLHTHGPNVLRVKGVVDVDDVGPVAVNGVQHVIHPRSTSAGYPLRHADHRDRPRPRPRPPPAFLQRVPRHRRKVT
ncbi:MAG: GTP-binding protein [Streptosporangiales bacterium]|nr:GTP-binding protein [Streptosporangiales bacterium]